MTNQGARSCSYFPGLLGSGIWESGEVGLFDSIWRVLGIVWSYVLEREGWADESLLWDGSACAMSDLQKRCRFSFVVEFGAQIVYWGGGHS